ncbi:hypothetical protein FRB90_008932 [Tulasnella sp. 427]|nr:hypothetical protein FRB90_008932 [Tulasnella sp. 427]
MKLSSSAFTAVAFAILSASGLRAAPHHHHRVSSAQSSSSSSTAAASSTKAVLDAATLCAAVSTVTVHDVQTVFVTAGGNNAATTTTKAGAKTTTTKAAGTKATTTKPVVEAVATEGGNKAVTTSAAKSTTTTTTTVTVHRSTVTSPPASVKTNSGKATNNNKGNNKGGKGGKIVTVTKTIKHVKPIFSVVTKTKNNQVVVTTTAVSTVTSTEIKTVTAEASPTTIISTQTLDQPITVTATVTEKGQEVVKTTEVLTQVVTVTSDVVSETLAATTTDLAVSTTATTSAGIESVSATSATASETASATTTTSAADTTATDDPQSSLTLDKRNIMTSQASDGNPSDGQVASLTSTNNFINFCLTQNVPITNGQQIKTGSCNPVPMGRILSTDRLPSSVFIFPTNFGTIPANTPFTIKMKIKNLQTGNFVNAAANYYSAPAQVDETGTLIGHSHCVIEPLDSFDQTKPTDPTTFSFFKGLNGVAQDGILTADVTGGLPAGKYRIGSINAAANHQPALAAVAQHGTLDAWAYFTVA